MDLNQNMIPTEQCASAFGRIFWAFLFFLDFRIGINNVHIDLLPDFIGWMIVYGALTSILELSPRVAGFRTMAVWLIALSFFDLIEIRAPLNQSGAYTSSISLMFPIKMIATILEIIFIWKLCGLIIDMAVVVGDSIIRDRADFRRKLYVAFIISMMIAAAISFVVPPFMFLVLISGIPLSIIIFCLMMGLMRGTEQMCRGYRIS